MPVIAKAMIEHATGAMMSNTLPGVEAVKVSSERPQDSFWISDWSTTALLVGLTIPLIVWNLVTFGSLLPLPVAQFTFPVMAAAMLVYPLVTRQKVNGAVVQYPDLSQLGREAATAVGIVVMCLLLNLLVMALFKWIVPTAPYAPDRLYRAARSGLTPQFLVIAGYSTLFTPLAEEVFFRGFLINALKRRLPHVAAIVVQAVLFGVMHGYGVGATVSTVMLGAVLGLLYCWRQTILTPFLVHAGYNSVGFAVIIVGMLASGSQGTLGVILDMNTERCVVKSVVPDSPAEQAGLFEGDIIRQIDDCVIGRGIDLPKCVSGYDPGTAVTVRLTRGNRNLTKRLKLVRRDQIGKTTMFGQ